MEKINSRRLQYRTGIRYLHRHERHPFWRRTRKPSLALCRPMGLGTRHHQRRQKRRIPERDRKPYLRSHDPHRIHGIRNVSSDQTLSATEVTFHPFGRIAPALSEPWTQMPWACHLPEIRCRVYHRYRLQTEWWQKAWRTCTGLRWLYIEWAE